MIWFQTLKRQLLGGAKAVHATDVQALIKEVERLQGEIETARTEGFRAGQSAGFALARACVEEARQAVANVVESKTAKHFDRLRAATTLGGLKAAEEAIVRAHDARMAPPETP